MTRRKSGGDFTGYNASQCRFRLSTCLEQYLDLAVTTNIRIGERTDPNLIRRHAGLNQRVTNRCHAAVVEPTVTPIRAAVDADLEGWIPRQIRGDLGNPAHLGIANVCRHTIEMEFTISSPICDDTHDALGPGLSRLALAALIAGRSGIAGDASDGEALFTRLSALALHPGGTNTAGSAGRANESGTLLTRVSHVTLRADGTRRTSGTGRTRHARALSTGIADIARRAGGTHGTGVAASADNNVTRSTCRSSIALRTSGACRSGFAWRAAQGITRCTHRTCRTLRTGGTGRTGVAPGAD